MKTLRLILVWFFIIVFLMSFFGAVKESFAMNVNDSINNFAFNTAKIIRNSSEEYFFSPYSILSAFGMAYAGAEGNTAREIEERYRGRRRSFIGKQGMASGRLEAERFLQREFAGQL